MYDINNMVTTREAAEMLGISVHGVIKAIERDQLIATKFGHERRGMWLISRSSVIEYRETRRSPGRPPKDSTNGLEEIEQK